MPITFNGVTIPENVANALSYNGVNITQVIYDGVTVWQQSLFSAQWSGYSSLSYYGATYTFETSGSNFRAILSNSNTGSTSDYGWASIDVNGNFTGAPHGTGVTAPLARLEANFLGYGTNTISTVQWSGSLVVPYQNYTYLGGVAFNLASKSFSAINASCPTCPTQPLVSPTGQMGLYGYAQISGNNLRTVVWHTNYGTGYAGGWITLN